MGVLKNAILDRIKGDQPSAPRAMIAAVVAGAMAAGVTYKVLRG